MTSSVQGNLSVTTTRLLKNVLNGSCLWTDLRQSEGFGYEKTLDELKEMYPDDEDEMEEGNGVPEAIKDMRGNKNAIEALGTMIWRVPKSGLNVGNITLTTFKWT